MKNYPLHIIDSGGDRSAKYTCACGASMVLTKYKIHLEMSLTFRDYHEICPTCRKKIEVRDLDDEDLKEQEYLC